MYKIYERFHRGAKPQKRVVGEKNFTYRILIGIIKNCMNKDVRRVLDIGCGVGTISFYLANKGLHVTGIDVSKNAIDNCKQTAANLCLKNKTEFILGTLEKINFNKKFDLVICSEVIEHISDDKNFLKIIHKVTRKGGILILSTPSINAPLYKLGFSRQFDKRVGHLRRYERNDIEKLVKSAGFLIKELKLTEGILRNFLFLSRFGWTIKFFKGIISDVVTVIDNSLISIFGESQIFVIAKK